MGNLPPGLYILGQEQYLHEVEGKLVRSLFEELGKLEERRPITFNSILDSVVVKDKFHYSNPRVMNSHEPWKRRK